MTKGERVRAALAGEFANRAPFAFWHHFRDVPPAGEAFVRATLNFYDTYDPDLLKVMQDGSYELPVDTPVYERAEQWRDLPVNPPDSGVFGEQIRSLQAIVAHKNDDAPVLATVTSVFLEAQRITGGRLQQMLDAEPAVVLTGLKRLAAALAGYAKATIDVGGCAGVYLAVSRADVESLPIGRYVADFLPLDRLVLSGAASGWCNVVHVHGDEPDLEPFAPLIEMGHTVSWSDRASGPGLAQVRSRFNKCVMGGVNERRIGGATPDDVAHDIAEALERTGGGRGLIVAPGCTVPTETPPANLYAFKQAVERAPASAE